MRLPKHKCHRVASGPSSSRKLQRECSVYLMQSQEASPAWNPPQGPQFQLCLLYSSQQHQPANLGPGKTSLSVHTPSQRALTGPRHSNSSQGSNPSSVRLGLDRTHMSTWVGSGSSKGASPARLVAWCRAAQGLSLNSGLIYKMQVPQSMAV